MVFDGLAAYAGKVRVGSLAEVREFTPLVVALEEGEFVGPGEAEGL